MADHDKAQSILETAALSAMLRRVATCVWEHGYRLPMPLDDFVDLLERTRGAVEAAGGGDSWAVYMLDGGDGVVVRQKYGNRAGGESEATQ